MINGWIIIGRKLNALLLKAMTSALFLIFLGLVLTLLLFGALIFFNVFLEGVMVLMIVSVFIILYALFSEFLTFL